MYLAAIADLEALELTGEPLARGSAARVACPACAGGGGGATGPACEPGGGVCGGRGWVRFDPDEPDPETARALDDCGGVLEVFAAWRGGGGERSLADAFILCGIDEPHPKLPEALLMLSGLMDQHRARVEFDAVRRARQDAGGTR